jgi:Zn-dependent protease
MNPETIIQLRQQLEAIREFESKNASGRFSYAGYWGEFLLGILFLGHMMISPAPDSHILARVVYYLAGVAFTFQGLYLIIRFKMDKRVKLLLEAMLSVSESKSS